MLKKAYFQNHEGILTLMKCLFIIQQFFDPLIISGHPIPLGFSLKTEPFLP